MIIPSIDLMNGQAVQLQQGRKKILARDDVLDLAKKFSIYGEIAVIDLDAAMNTGKNNLALIAEICKIADCRVGGGIRSEAYANQVLSKGASKIIIGTQANQQFLSKFNPERTVAAVDSWEGKLVTHGWKEKTELNTIDMIQDLESYTSEFLYTNVKREGMMQGIDMQEIADLRSQTTNNFTYAGGITTIDEIVALENINSNSQLGMSIYTGSLMLEDILIAVLDFEKGKGLIPTIVQETTGQVQILAYSSKESLLQTLSSRKATFFSRSRNELWEKGKTSGNTLYVSRISYDCDRDSLLFKVDGGVDACHLERYSCFGEQQFSMERVRKVLVDRKNNPQDSSYTTSLLRNPEKIRSKILEEAREVVDFTDRENLIWELADLSYFMQVLMVEQNITPDEVLNELWRRRK